MELNTRSMLIFPGYTFANGEPEYRGEDPKEDGYVYSEPGIYRNAELHDYDFALKEYVVIQTERSEE